MMNKWTESLKLLTMAITMTVDIEVKSDHCVNITSVFYSAECWSAVRRLL